jgi:hypothetical protein
MISQILRNRIKSRLTPEEQAQLDAYDASQRDLQDRASNNLESAQNTQNISNALGSVQPALKNMVRAAGGLVSQAAKNMQAPAQESTTDLLKADQELALDNPISAEERNMMNQALARFNKEGEAPVVIPETFTYRQMDKNPVLKRFFTSIAGGPGMMFEMREKEMPDGSNVPGRFNKKTGVFEPLGEAKLT